MNVPKVSNTMHSESEEKVKLELIRKIQEVDGRYKKNLSTYKEGVYAFNLKIETLKRSILEAEEYFSEDVQYLDSLKNNLDYELHAFEKINAKLSQKIDSLYQLQNTYKALMEEKQYGVMVQVKEQEIEELIFEIDEKEHLLLTQELEHINLSNLLIPKKNRLKELQLELLQLELEKAHFESNSLDVPTLLAKKNETFETIDIEVLGKDD